MVSTSRRIHFVSLYLHCNFVLKIGKDTPQMELIDLILNDEQITNDRGYRILNSGLNRRRYDLNPVWLFQHDVDRLNGRCEGLRIEGSKLIGSFKVDEGNPEALEVARKINDGFLRGVSVGIFIEEMEWIGDELCVTKWELVETSSVTIPSNMGAVKLYSKDFLPLSDEEATSSIEQLSIRQNSNPENTDTMNPKNTPTPPTIDLTAEAFAALGLSAKATVAEISDAVVELAAQCNTLNSALEQNRVAARDEFLSAAIEKGQITEEQRATFAGLYDKDAALCRQAIEGLSAKPTLNKQPKNTLSGAVNHASKTSATEATAEDWVTLSKQGKLAQLKQEDPERFSAIYQARFGVAPKLD